MIKIALVIGLAFVIQFVLSSFQMKNFNNEFVRLRRKGKVAIGRKSGGFHAGAIVMFRIDEKGIIQESRKIEGTTFLARVKDFPGFEGRYVGDLSRVQKRRFSSKGGVRAFWEPGFSKPVKKSIKDVKSVTLASSDLPRRETTRGTIAYRKNRKLGKPSTHD